MATSSTQKEAYLNQKKHFNYDLLRDSHFTGSGMLDAAAPPVVAKPRPGSSSIQLGGYAPEWNKESVASSQWTTTYGAATTAVAGQPAVQQSRRYTQSMMEPPPQEHWMTTNNAFRSGFAEDTSDLQEGTAKAVGRVPGYSGYIPRSHEAAPAATRPAHDKSLVIENQRRFMRGYTGSLGPRTGQ